MRSEKVLDAYREVSKAEYGLGMAVDELKQAQYIYKEVLMDDCIRDILTVQSEDGKLSERDLKIFLRDLVSKVSGVKSV